MMSYLILRTTKIKSKSDYIAALKHHYRIGGLINADPDRRNLNVEYGAFEDAEARFDAFFNQKTGKFAKRRKDAVLGIEYLMTASPDFFKSISSQKIDEFFAECITWLCERHGRENILMLTVEYDETTPHLSAIIAPVDENGRLNSGSFLGGRSAMRLMQTQFHTYITEKGFNLKRGQPVEHTRASHKTVKTFYQEINQAIENKQFNELTMEQLQVGLEKYIKTNQILQDENDALLFENQEIKNWFIALARNEVSLDDFINYASTTSNESIYKLSQIISEHQNNNLKLKTHL